MGDSSIVLLLGAGFNADASVEVQHPSSHSYPSASDLAKICFGLEALPAGSSIEDLFADALQARRPEPLRTLCKVLMDADHHVALRLRANTNTKDNAYIAFLRQFALSTFLTFNYDSLLEILLLSLNRWRPADGYGLPVKVELPPYPPPLPASSTNLVLYLHGVLTVYPQEFIIRGYGQQPLPMLEYRRKPIFIFDPDVLADAFFPFKRAWPETSFPYPPERIIAPIPDKAPELTKAFVDRAYNRAKAIMKDATQIVAIGYRFGSYDRVSYDRLLGTARRGSTISVVSPEAPEIASGLRPEYPRLRWIPVRATFADWVREGFPLDEGV